MILNSPHRPVVIDPHANVHDFIMEHFSVYGDSLALSDLTRDRSFTYRQLSDAVRLSSDRLRSCYALKRNDVVASVISNCPEFVVVQLATFNSGAIFTGMHPNFTVDEISYQLQDSAAKFVLTRQDLLMKVLKACQRLKGQIQALFVVDLIDQHRYQSQSLPAVVDFNSLLEEAESNKAELCRQKVAVSSIDVALIPYSSGTTGKSKGILISHACLVTCLTIMNDDQVILGLKRGEAFVCHLPMFHGFCFQNLYQALRSGGVVLTMPKYNLELLLATIQNWKISILATVPPVVIQLTKDPLIHRYNLTSLRGIISAAAPIGKEVVEEFLRAHPYIVYFLPAYGMSEMLGYISSHPICPIADPNAKPFSVGVLCPNFQAKIVDCESGSTIAVNEIGEICARSAQQVMLGYLNRPDVTRETVDEQGWLHTGDIGFFDAQGYLYIVDRLKDLIKVNAFQVSPSELEDLLISHPAVLGAAVIGVPDVKMGELPRAYVVLKPEYKDRLKETDIIKFCDERVAYYKRLRGGVEFVEEIPKSPSGKILRREIRDSFRRKYNSKL